MYFWLVKLYLFSIFAGRKHKTLNIKNDDMKNMIKRILDIVFKNKESDVIRLDVSVLTLLNHLTGFTGMTIIDEDDEYAHTISEMRKVLDVDKVVSSHVKPVLVEDVNRLLNSRSFNELDNLRERIENEISSNGMLYFYERGKVKDRFVRQVLDNTLSNGYTEDINGQDVLVLESGTLKYKSVVDTLKRGYAPKTITVLDMSKPKLVHLTP